MDCHLIDSYFNFFFYDCVTNGNNFVLEDDDVVVTNDNERSDDSAIDQPQGPQEVEAELHARPHQHADGDSA